MEVLQNKQLISSISKQAKKKKRERDGRIYGLKVLRDKLINNLQSTGDNYYKFELCLDS